jgi:hypothetical protein
LTLLVRHMAWLNAKPKPDPRTRRGKRDEAPKVSRLERLKKNGVTPPMPPNPAPHIFDRLIEIGLTEAAGMGAAPISWREIDAWCSRTGIDLDPWEARLIRSLSTAYIAEGHRAEAETCPPPWRAPVTEREIQVEIDVLDMVLG